MLSTVRQIRFGTQLTVVMVKCQLLQMDIRLKVYRLLLWQKKTMVKAQAVNIHETNLKKQGMLALTFADKDDYDKVQEHDRISIVGLESFAPGRNLKVVLTHEDGTQDSFEAVHTYNEMQIEWFKAGSALNTFRK